LDYMNDLFAAFAQSMSDENNMTLDQAHQLTEWLANEGVLDFDVLRETYQHELPTATVLVFPMGAI